MDNPKSLFEHLNEANKTLASFARVIIFASEQMTKGSSKNDFAHSEAVHWRLSELLENHLQYEINDTEVFILCACAYLHDIGYSVQRFEKAHGQGSAHLITHNESLKYLFPAGHIQDQIARVCSYHDREVNELEDLAEAIKLDIRYSNVYKDYQKIEIHPRFLAAVFRLADELECISDRMLGQLIKDARVNIAGVRINTNSRQICIDFRQGTKEEDRKTCKQYFNKLFNELDRFLRPFALSLKIVDQLPKKDLWEKMDEPESIFDEIGIAEKVDVSISDQSGIGDVINTFKKERMSRINLIENLLAKKGSKK